MSRFSLKTLSKKAFHLFLAVWYGMVSTEAVWYEPYHEETHRSSHPSHSSNPLESLKTDPIPRLRFDLDIKNPSGKLWVSLINPGEEISPLALHPTHQGVEEQAEDVKGHRFVGNYGGATFDFRVVFPSPLEEGGSIGSVELYQLTSLHAVDFITNGLLVTHTLESMNDVRISADRCITKGTLSTKGDLTLWTKRTLLNYEGSSLKSAKLLQLLSPDGKIKNHGAIEGAQVKVKASGFLNKAGKVLSKNIKLKLSKELANKNRSLIVASEKLSIFTPSLKNINSSFISSQGEVLAEKVYLGQEAVFSSTQILKVQASLLELQDRSRLFAGVQGDIMVNDLLNQSSAIEGGKDLNLFVHRKLSQVDADIAADRRIHIQHSPDSFAYDLSNNSEVTPFTFDNIRSHVRSAGTLFVEAPKGDVTNQEGSFEAIISDMNVKSFLNDHGTIESTNNRIHASFFKNRRGAVIGDNVVLKIKLPFGEKIPGSSWQEQFKNIRSADNILKGHVLNQGGTIRGHSSLIIDAENVLLNNGLIQGGRDLQLTALVLGNINGGQIIGLSNHSSSNHTIKVKGDLYNQGENSSISSGSKLTLNSTGKILNHKGALIRSGETILSAYEEFSNDSAHLEAIKSLNISTPQGKFTNRESFITAGDFIFDGRDFYNFNKGAIETNSMQIKALGTVYNCQSSYISAQNGMGIESLYLDNSEGSLFAETINLNLGNNIANDFYALKSFLVPHNPFSAKEKNKKQGSNTSSSHANASTTPQPSSKGDTGTAEKEKQEPAQPPQESPPETPSPSAEPNHQPTTTREAGCLINTTGNIVARSLLTINGTGDLYNSDSAHIICEQGPIEAKVLGRIMNQDDSELSSFQSLNLTAGGVAFNGANSTIKSGENLTIQAGRVTNQERGAIIGEHDLTATASEGIYNKSSLFQSGGHILLEGGTVVSNDGEDSKIISQDKSIKISGTKSVTNTHGYMKANDIDLLDITSLRNAKGTLFSKNRMTITGLEGHFYDNIFNDHGILEAVNQLTIESSTLFPMDIGGTLKSANLSINSSQSPTSLLEFHTLFSKAKLDVSHLVLNLPNFPLINNQNTVLDYGLTLTAKQFSNRTGRFWSKKPLSIITQNHITNGHTHLQSINPTYYPFYNDWDIRNDQVMQGLLGDFSFYYGEASPITAVIGSDEALLLQSGVSLMNTGGIEGGGRVTLSSPKITNGWAHEDQDTTVLSEGHTGQQFDWHNWFYKPQPSYILSHDLLTINGNRGSFSNVFGTVEAHRGLDVDHCNSFLNFAGHINVSRQPSEAKIRSTHFINTLGVIATNIAHKRYWSIDYANTDPAFFNVHEGVLQIETQWARNSASFLYGRDGVLINGQPSEEFTQAINMNRQLAYTRMYTMNWTTSETTTNRCLGIRTGSSTTHTHWTGHFNETMNRDTLPGSISSRGPVNLSQDKVVQQGLAHGSSVTLEAKRGPLTHGYQENLALKAQQALPTFVDGGELIREIPLGGIYQKDVASSPFLLTRPMPATEIGAKLYLTILDNPSLSWPAKSGLLGTLDYGAPIKLAAAPEILSLLLTLRLQQVYSTGYLPSLVSLAEESKRAYEDALTQDPKSLKPQSIFGNALPEHLTFLAENSGASESLLFLPYDKARKGLYFQPQMIGETMTLVPIYYPDLKDLHPAIGRRDGATVAQVNPQSTELNNGIVSITTERKGDPITGMVFGEKGIVIDAKEGASAKTRHHTTKVTTHGTDYSSSRGGPFSSETKSTWVKIQDAIKAELPTRFETGLGGKVTLKTGLDSSFDFEGVEVIGGGDFSFCGHRLIIEPLEEEELVSCTPGSAGGMLSTIRPRYLKTLFLFKGQATIDADIYENLGSALLSVGDINFNARTKIIQKILGKSYVASHQIDAKHKALSSTVNAQTRTETVTSIPETQSLQGSLKWNAPYISFEGILGAHGGSVHFKGTDIEGQSRTFTNSATFCMDQDTLFRSTTVSSHMEQSYLVPTVVLASQDFIIEAVNRYFEQGINVKIGGDVYQRAHTLETRGIPLKQTIHTTMESSGFSFFGSETIEHAINGDWGKAGQAFVNNIPLVQQLKAWDQSQSSADKTVAATKSLIALYNNAHQIAQGASQGGWQGAGKSLLNVLNVGELSFSTTRTESHSETKSTAPTYYEVQGKIDRQSTGSQILADGPVMQSVNQQIYKGETIQVTPAITQTISSETTQTETFGINPLLMSVHAGISGGESTMDSKTHSPATFVSKKAEISFDGTQSVSLIHPAIESPVETLIKAPTIQLQALPDTVDQKSRSYNVGITVGFSPAAAGKMAAETMLNLGFGKFRSHTQEAPTNSKIKGPVRLESANPIRNIGVLLEDPNGAIISAPSYVFEAIEGSRTKDGFGFNMNFNLSSPEAFERSVTKNIACSAAALAAGEVCHLMKLGDTAASLTGMLASAAVSNTLNERWKAEDALRNPTPNPSETRDKSSVNATGGGFGDFFGDASSSGLNVGGEATYSHGTHTTTAPLIDLDVKNLQQSWKTLRQGFNFMIGEALSALSSDAPSLEVEKAIKNSEAVDEILSEKGLSASEREKTFQDKDLAAALQLSIVAKEAIEEVVRERPNNKQEKKSSRTTKARKPSSQKQRESFSSKDSSSKAVMLSPQEEERAAQIILNRLGDFAFLYEDPMNHTLKGQYLSETENHTPSPSKIRKLVNTLQAFKEQHPVCKDIELGIELIGRTVDLLAKWGAYGAGYMKDGKLGGERAVVALNEMEQTIGYVLQSGLYSLAEWYESRGVTGSDKEDRRYAVIDLSNESLPYASFLPFMRGSTKKIRKGLLTQLERHQLRMINNPSQVIVPFSPQHSYSFQSSFWNRADTHTFRGQTNKVYKRDDLIDLNRVDPKGRTSLELMQRGLAPVGPDGKPLNLHHTIQTQNGPLAEVTQTFHQQNTKVIHINQQSTPSGIQRTNVFDTWRSDYWKQRAKEFMEIIQ